MKRKSHKERLERREGEKTSDSGGGGAASTRKPRVMSGGKEKRAIRT